MKNIELKQFRRTKMHKHKIEENRDKDKGHIPYHLFFMMNLAVICFMLLFAGISVASVATVYIATDGSGDYNCDGVEHETVISDCEAAWNSRQGANVISTISNDSKVGNYSVKLTVSDDATPGLLATKDFSLLNLSEHNTLKLWFKSNISFSGEDFKLHLSSTSNCGGSPNEEEIKIGEWRSFDANVWYLIGLKLANPTSDTAIISVGIEMVNDKGAFELYIDHITENWADEYEINQAIDYINSIGGGTVHLKSGTYIIGDSVVMKSNVTLEGDDSSSTIIKLMDNCTYPAKPGSKNHMILLISSGPGMPRYPPEITNITIQNLQVDANKRGNPTHIPHYGIFSRCIHIKSTHSTYRNILIRDMSNDGIYLEGSHNDIIDCRGELVGHDAVRLKGNTYSNVINFTNFENGNNIVRLTNCQYCTLDNITGRGGDTAIQFTTAGSGHCAHNILKNSVLTTDQASAWYGVVLHERDSGSVYDNKIINTIIWNTFKDGIRIETGVKNTTIENCVIYNSRYSGIKIDDASGTGTIIKNSIITDNAYYGIDGDATSTYNDIWNNALGNYNGTSAGTGDISMDPIFADPANGDFHLKSEAGRWNGSTRIQDNVTSKCIDAGDPSYDFSNEPKPNAGG